MIDVPGGTPRNLTASYDFDIGGSLGGDQRAPRGAHAGRAGLDGGRTRRSSSRRRTGQRQHGARRCRHRDKSTPTALPAQARRHVLHRGNACRAIRHGASTPTVDRRSRFVGGSRPAHRRSSPSFNDALFAQLDLTEPEEIWYTSFDGKKIQGWIQKPPDFDPAKKYPLILEIHGGPHSAYGNTFTHEFQWMAAKGYVVLYTESARQLELRPGLRQHHPVRYPGDDYKDLMAGVDEVREEGYIDEKRLGVTGGSGGGLLTNWVVTQTDALQGRGQPARHLGLGQLLVHRRLHALHADLVPQGAVRGSRRTSPSARRSPTSTKIQTPLMFILGDEDYRTPPAAGGEELFRALKFLKRPTVMVRFPGENHELSRSGKPWHRVERLQHIVGWFDRYLSVDK